ncbi:hypothetical protein ABC003_03719 [Acinetobacter baumannii]|nr:hypothetical protein ABC003_03719 [Acinetobacter baumannii]
MVGPIAGPNVLIMPNMTKGNERFASGKSKYNAVMEVGIIPPPINPCMPRKTSKLSKFHDKAQSKELTVKPIAHMV